MQTPQASPAAPSVPSQPLVTGLAARIPLREGQSCSLRTEGSRQPAETPGGAAPSTASGDSPGTPQSCPQSSRGWWPSREWLRSYRSKAGPGTVHHPPQTTKSRRGVLGPLSGAPVPRTPRPTPRVPRAPHHHAHGSPSPPPPCPEGPGALTLCPHPC